MISTTDLNLLGWSCLLSSLITFTTVPLISWCSLLISLLSYTIIYFSSPNITSSNAVTKNGGDPNGCIFLWKIENISDSWLKKGTCIRSPAFTANPLDGTKWSLLLSPKGGKNDNAVTAFLKRENGHFGPDVMQVKYQVAFLGKDGSVLECKPVMEAGFETRNYALFRFGDNVTSGGEKTPFFPEDTLTIRCDIWKKTEKPVTPELLSGRTIFKEHRRSFVWKVDEFSTFRTSPRRKYTVINKLTYDLIDFKLVLSEGKCSEKKLDVDIRSSEEGINFFSFKASVIDSEGKRASCGNHEYSEGDLKKGILLTLFYVKEMLMNEKSLYLPNDVLSLDCEYAFTAVSTSQECANCGTISSSVPQGTVKKKEEIYANREKRQPTTLLVDHLKSMYSDAILSDINLRTSTQTFPAHKAILSVRSSVFRKMFSSDMKETNSGYVDITDIEDEIIHRMLTYMYTDSLGDLHMESASKLYTAADKYDIPYLKSRCCSFLKNHLSPITACDVLVLADMHQDHDLKSAVVGYILEHDKEVFETLEWRNFMATYLQLAADVMYQKVSQASI